MYRASTSAWVSGNVDNAPDKSPLLNNHRQVLIGCRVHWSSDRHSESVNCVAWSNDGKTLASASSDTTIRLWNMETGKSHEERL